MLAVGAPHYPATPAPRHLNVAGLTNRERTLLAVDDALKAIIDTLRTTSQLDKTYVVLTSDHGLSSRSGSKPKGVPYEGSIRVPLVVRGPGVPAGTTVPHLTNLADLAPTFLDWLNVSGARCRRTFVRDTRRWQPADHAEAGAAPPRSRMGRPTPRPTSPRGRASAQPATPTSSSRAAPRSSTTSRPTRTSREPRPRQPHPDHELATLADDLANCTSAQCREIENRPVD
jgi:hypothetical protein